MKTMNAFYCRRKWLFSLTSPKNIMSLHSVCDPWSDSLLQAAILHFLVSWALPWQKRPPYAGYGASHFRKRCWVPWPHDTEQGVKSDHSDQPPSTENQNKENITACSHAIHVHSGNLSIAMWWTKPFNFPLQIFCCSPESYYMGYLH